MEEKPEEITTDSGNIVERNPDGTFKEGHSKLGGKQSGTRDFATDFDEVVKDIAKENNLTVSDVRKVLLKQAYKQAKDGNYSFYKDIHDRVYGQAVRKNEISGKNGELLQIIVPQAVVESFNIHATNQETGRSNTE